MRKTFRHIFCVLAALAAFGASGTAIAQAKEEAKLIEATAVLNDLRAQRDTRIPEWLLQRAYGVAVVPDVLKAALFLGARRGSGVLTVRDSRGRFSSPIFINLTGGSFGAQFGAQETDIVLVFTTRSGTEGIEDGKLTLGVGASVAAGPVGRQAEAAAGVNAEVYAYSRARGLFAGIALDGTALSIDTKGNRAFYGKRDVTPSDIRSGAAKRDSENARRFLAALASSTGETAEAATGNAGAAPASEHTGHAGQSGAAVETFPMEDPAPGREPR